MKKFLLFSAGFLAGAAYILLGFVAAFQISFWSASHGLSGKEPLILLACISLALVICFYILSWVFSKKLHCGKHAFPIGSFLAGDGLLLSVPLLKILDVEHLKTVVGNDGAMAKTYAYLVMVTVAAITFLVVSWMISVLFAQFKKFRMMSELLAAQNAALLAQAAQAQAQVTPTTETPAVVVSPEAEQIPRADQREE